MKKHKMTLFNVVVFLIIGLGLAGCLSGGNGGQFTKSVVDLETYVTSLPAGATTEYTNNTISMTVDYSKVLVWPLTGFYEYKFTQGVINATKAANATAPLPGIDRSLFNNDALLGRAVKFYIPQNTSLNAYIYVIAVPNGINDVYDWLSTEGWIEQAETYGEALVILEPNFATKTWGTPAQEVIYLAACLNEAWATAGTNSDPKTVTQGGIVTCGRVPFSNGKTFWFINGMGANYYVGYGAGSAVLESWTATNPVYVISQAFINGTSAGNSILTTAGNGIYKGTTASGQGDIDDIELNATIASINQHGGFGEVGVRGNIPAPTVMRKDIIPIPTLLVGGSYNDSADYWKRVNDVINPATADSMSTVGTARASVFKQKNVSPAWQTEYANRNIRRWNTGTAATYGVSEVQIVNSYVPSAIKADDIRIFLAQFTRYTTVWAFSNYLINRLDYMATTKEAREVINLDNPIATHTYEMFTTVNNADIANNPSYSETIAPGVVQLLTVKSTTVKAPNTPANRGTGKIYSVMLAYKDYKAGTGEGLNPREAIIYVPDSIDLTKKAPLVFVHPGGSGAALRFMDAPGLWSIANDEGFAMVVIGNQHRGGSMDVGYDGLTRDNANYIRAVLKLLDNEVGNVIVSDYRGFMVDKGRIYLVGHSSGCYEAMNSAVGPLRNDVAAVGATSRLNAGFHFEADLMPIYGFMGHLDGNNTQLWGPAAGTSDVNRWVNKVWAMNGIRTQFTGNATATEAEFINATSADYNQFGRHKNYTWYNQQNIPLVRFTRTLAREHNAYPEEFREIWKFVSSFRKEANGRRYYSPSGFVAAGDERLIN